jgi:hypothetical protein
MHRTRILRRGTHWRGRISTRVIPLGIWASFAVTAEHVYDDYLEDRAARRIRSCQIGNVAFDDPEDRLIARSEAACQIVLVCVGACDLYSSVAADAPRYFP